MTFQQVINIHKKATKKIYLNYKYNKKIKLCYIDPARPLLTTFGFGPMPISDLIDPKSDVEVGVYKADTDVRIYVSPENLFFQCPKKEQIMKVLYGI